MRAGPDRSHNRGVPGLDDVSPGTLPAPASQAPIVSDEVARADAEAKLIAARSKAHLDSLGMIGRFVGDVQRATLLGMMLLILISLIGLVVAAYVDHSHVAALVEVAKAVVFAGLGYMGARYSAQER